MKPAAVAAKAAPPAIPFSAERCQIALTAVSYAIRDIAIRLQAERDGEDSTSLPEYEPK
jgi:hypothetical protein